MNLPNQLTLLRLILTALFVAAMTMKFQNHCSVGLILFIVAALTDFLDGHIARRYNLITNFGKLMDPLADKVLMAAVWVILTHVQIQAWIVIVILAREFLVTGLRLLASSQGSVVAADNLGKQKTIWQFITAVYFLLNIASIEPPMNWSSPIFAFRPTSPAFAGNILLIIVLVLTVWSGIGYVIKNKHVLVEKPPA